VKNVIHEGLERGRRVAKAERHHQELVQVIVRAERRLLDVLWAHAHLVIRRSQIQLGEETCAMELVEELVHHRDQEGVLDGERV
jgi:hypothetical protein